MMDQISGSMWILVAIGFACAAAGFVYGSMRSRKKTAAEHSAQTAASREIYRREPE
jgi:hypothetical protein